MVGRLCVAPVEAQFATEIVVQVIKRGFNNTATGTKLVWLLACSRAHVLLGICGNLTEEGKNSYQAKFFFFQAYQAKLYGRSALISLIIDYVRKRKSVG
jgi:hypothetical protein